MTHFIAAQNKSRPEEKKNSTKHIKDQHTSTESISTIESEGLFFTIGGNWYRVASDEALNGYVANRYNFKGSKLLGGDHSYGPNRTCYISY